MAQRSEILAVYVAGVIQGVALVTFPAASAVFTSPGDYGLSNTQYGGLFVPQALMAIVASLLGAALRKRLGAKLIYMLGLIANLLAMTLLVLSRFLMQHHEVAYAIILLATTCLGVGFGFTVPALNTLAAIFFPQNVDKAVLALNALLGLGTALAPVFVALFVGLGIWWGLPVMVGGLILALLLFSLSQPLNEARAIHAEQPQRVKNAIPMRFLIFAAFALLYGVCETMNGNWAALYMKEHLGASPALSALALTMFWSMVTAGRILFAALESWLPEALVYRILPLVLTAALIASACVPKSAAALGIATFALAGLGCSALLPLSISFGQRALTSVAASVAGGLIAFYQLGYGIAAFGVGPLQLWAGIHLNDIYGGTAIVALAMCGLSFVITRNRPAPAKGGPSQSPPAVRLETERSAS
ncbi:MAG: MFS transporter [Steroidobacteraceae bacterium]